MWMAPPSGLRFISALTTTSVRCAVSSRTRDDAALCPPLTARNALVTAMAIFDGSKATTAPLRRMTLYWESVGSVLGAGGEPVPAVMHLRGAVVARGGLAPPPALVLFCWGVGGGGGGGGGRALVLDVFFQRKNFFFLG